MIRLFKRLDKFLVNPPFKFLCRSPRLNININGCLKYSDESSPVKQKFCPEAPKKKLKKQLLDLAGKTTVVVGGDDGIGYAAAFELLSQQAKVVGIFGSNACKGRRACRILNERFGDRKAMFFPVNIDKDDKIICAMCNMTKEFGAIETFVNAFGECNGKNWEKELALNLIGMTRCTILAHQYFLSKKQPGVIVNTAGIFGKLPLAGCPTTSAAQHGIVGLSKSFGNEELFKTTKVRVVVLCPGITDNDMFRKAEKRALTPFMGTILKNEIAAMKKQRAEVCGKAIVYMINIADSGSVWFIEGNELYRMNNTSPYDNAELHLQYP